MSIASLKNREKLFLILVVIQFRIVRDEWCGFYFIYKISPKNLDFCSICTISGYAEDTPARKNSKNIWFFARLFVSLQHDNEKPIHDYWATHV